MDKEIADLEKANKRANLNTISETINEALLKKLNARLEAEKPSKLIEGLELFVSLLRKKDKCTHVDVKLYLADMSKLHYKMRTIDAASLNKG